MKVAEALELIRRREGLTQKELSERSGISEQTVSKILKGKGGESFTLETLEALTGAMGYSFQDFCYEIVKIVGLSEDIIRKVAAEEVRKVLANLGKE